MEIDASPIKGKVLNPRHEDWIAQVVPHELTHAAQAEIRGGFGVGDFIRIFSPDWARAINFGEPRGLTEGVAVSFESRGPGDLGRLNYSFTLMQVRAAAATNPWTMSQVFDPPRFTRPFDRYYTGGGVLYDYLADSVRTDFFVESARFYNRWPFLGYGVALWQATGRAPWTLSRQFVRYSRHELTPNHVQNRSSTRLSGSPGSWNSGPRTTDDGPRTTDDGPRTTDVRGLSCRRPKWRDNQTLIAYCSGYNIDRGLYRIDVLSGSRTLLSRRVVTEDYYLSLDAGRRGVLFADYQPLRFTTDAFVTRLERVDLQTGKATANRWVRSTLCAASPRGWINADIA